MLSGVEDKNHTFVKKNCKLNKVCEISMVLTLAIHFTIRNQLPYQPNGQLTIRPIIKLSFLSSH